MSFYSSDSDFDYQDQHGKPLIRFGPQRPLHATFGGGKVADIVLWRDKKLSAAILIGLTIIWFLFEVEEFHFVTLLCYLLLITMVAIFLWFRTAWIINRNPPNIDEIELPESTCRFFFKKLNRVLMKFYEISTGEDVRLFFLAIASLWVLSILGTCVSTLNLIFLVVLCMETLPTFYERNQREVDKLATKVYVELKKLYKKFKHTVLDKIPRGPVKGKDL
ncbi:hypothetical protein UlMin_040475 [Ulmus minor]